MSDNRTPFSARLHNVVSLIARYFKVEKCSVMLINLEDMTLEVHAATHSAIVGMKRSLSDVTIATRALLEDAPFETNRKRLSYFTPADTTKYSSCYSLSLPIKFNNKKIGVINITDTLDCKRMTRAQIKEAVKLTGQLAVYLYAEQADDLLENRIKKHEDAMAYLKKADEMKTGLTGFIVHDLKGPVSTIMANMDMLSYEPLNAPQLELVTLALNDVYKMQRMVMNILDVMKMEERGSVIYREEVDLRDLVQREITSLKGLLALRGIQIVFDGGPRALFIDENLIGRTISNLLLNAIEHSPDGKQIRVNISYDAGTKETVFGVADEGPGIPDDFKGKVFDKFFQIETGKMYRNTTTGLGLTFCKLVIDAHEGRLWAEDNEGGGTRFIFTLPDAIKEVLG
ncbi:MAG: ATP-binding protein [Dissulfurispiraceae bacterium]